MTVPRFASWALLLTLGLGSSAGAALASTLPTPFTLKKTAETWKEAPKKGLRLQWEVQDLSLTGAEGAIAPEGALPALDGSSPSLSPAPWQSGELLLKGGRYRASWGEGDDQTLQVFDNVRGVKVEAGVARALPAESHPVLPAGLFLRGRSGLGELISVWGIDDELASWGRMPTEDEALHFHPVVRHGAPAGAMDLERPQMWIEPHDFLIHRVVVFEGDHLRQVDYRHHGEVSEELPWLPAVIEVREDGELVWRARITGVLTTAPTDKDFNAKALLDEDAS